MPEYLKSHYDTEGPFGLPMKDRQAKALETRLKVLPREPAYEFRRASLGTGLSELAAGERADVSWITADSPDRQGDVVLARGMDDAHFQLNPIVTLNHRYDQPPVGRSLWRRKVREGRLEGVKAKTIYPAKPSDWIGDWFPDYAWELVKADLLRGKSIGFFPLKVRAPTPAEIEERSWSKVRFVIEEWLLAEYACCYLPVQPHALVEQVAKSLPVTVLQLAGVPFPLAPLTPTPLSKEERGLAGGFTSLPEIESGLLRYLKSSKGKNFLEKALQRTLWKARGRV